MIITDQKKDQAHETIYRILFDVFEVKSRKATYSGWHHSGNTQSWNTNGFV